MPVKSNNLSLVLLVLTIFEWGVTLFSDDVLQFKKIVYEMRFDETTARYGDFGSFYVGHILNTDDFNEFFNI